VQTGVQKIAYTRSVVAKLMSTFKRLNNSLEIELIDLSSGSENWGQMADNDEGDSQLVTITRSPGREKRWTTYVANNASTTSVVAFV
jgi:hypothetical protein